MSAHARRVVLAQLVVAVVAMLCVTGLAILKDISGETAVTVIVGVLGIGSTHSAAALRTGPSYVLGARQASTPGSEATGG